MGEPPLTVADQLAHEAAAREQHAHGAIHDRAACGLCPPPATATPGQAIDVRAPEPGESRKAYQAYLDGLFAPVAAEVNRLRAGLAGSGAAPARPLTAPDVVAGLLADVAGSRAQLADAAPELAAAMAETRAVRDGAGLPGLPRNAAAGDREDVTMRYRRERDEARAQADELRNALTLARTAAREMSDEFTTWTVTPEDQQRITGWRQQAGLEAGGGQPADVRPRDGEPGWLDVTCGGCGEEFGTNFAAAELECPECEARRCPSCHAWFGGDGG